MTMFILSLILIFHILSYDDDTSLDFTWTPSTGPVDHYEVWVSKNNSKFRHVMDVREPRCTIVGEDGSYYRVKVRAADGKGNFSEFSDVSDTVVCRVIHKFSLGSNVVWEMRYSKRKKEWEVVIRSGRRTLRRWWVSEKDLRSFRRFLDGLIEQ